MAFLDSISFADRDDIQCLFGCTGEVGWVAFTAEIIAVLMCCLSSSRHYVVPVLRGLMPVLADTFVQKLREGWVLVAWLIAFVSSGET